MGPNAGNFGGGSNMQSLKNQIFNVNSEIQFNDEQQGENHQQYYNGDMGLEQLEEQQYEDEEEFQ